MEPAPFSIVVPIYNEVDAVAGAIAVLAELEPVRRGVCQVVLVDDGSDDGSSDILAEVDLPGFKVIHHRRNRGYGAALKTGVKAAEHPLVVITDADDTYPNHRIPELVGMLEERGLDMLVGARQGAGIPLSRRPAKWVLGKLANYLSGVKIPDLNSGLRVMRKEVVEKFLRILPDGFSFTTTITLAMLTNDHQVEWEPIDYQVRSGKSKIRPIQDTLYFLQLIIRTMLYFQPLKIFGPISALFMLTGLGLLIYRLVHGPGFAVTATVLFICGVQLLALGLIADFLDKRL